MILHSHLDTIIYTTFLNMIIYITIQRFIIQMIMGCPPTHTPPLGQSHLLAIIYMAI